MALKEHNNNYYYNYYLIDGKWNLHTVEEVSIKYNSFHPENMIRHVVNLLKAAVD